jgi:hypothetical protein
VTSAPKRPIDGAVISSFDYLLLAEQDQLATIPPEVAVDLHLYMICRRPRITVVSDEFRATADSYTFVFAVQHQDEQQRVELVTPNLYERSDIEMRSQWPYGDFVIATDAGERLTWGRASLLPGELGCHFDSLDLEVLYVGQAYGSGGERSATARLAQHPTLQAIYGEAVRHSPDMDVFLVLLSLDGPTNLVLLSPVPGDEDDLVESYLRLTTPISEQQRINFTEAALIKHFEPSYNKIYKNTFPSPAHKTYSECYDLDLNLVGFELETGEVLRTRLWSPSAERSWYHVREFPLHDTAERRHLFDFAPDV